MVMEEQQSDMELDSERVPVPQVQKSTEDKHVETSNKVTSVSRGKPRLRKKALNAAILKQMEFYFSDANLGKDRFLGNLLRNDPYVDLGVFIKFNRIRDLTTDTNRIAKALQSSTVLSLSEDGTKVCRITPIVEKENTEECTVYVQNLPSDADHEMLSTIFSQYGPVAYVSVPRYKRNKKIKGFAFVEFDTPENAIKCLKSFEKKGCLLPSHTCPDGLLSITTFDDNEKDVTRMGKLLNENIANKNVADDNTSKEGDETSENKIVEVDMEEERTTADKTLESVETKEKKKAKKRKHKSGELMETADPSIAEKKVENTEGVKGKKKKYKHPADIHEESVEEGNNDEKKKASSENQDDSNCTKKSGKHKKNATVKEDQQESSNCNTSAENASGEENMETSNANEENENTKGEKKKKRKRKRKSKAEDVSLNMGLQAMAKKDWKHLRNKYLELQRSKMKQLKQHLLKTRLNQLSNYEKLKTEKEENYEKEKTTPKQDGGRFSFAPGVIVKIEMDKPCTDPKGFKNELKGNSSVKYIDVKESSYHAYVRYDTAEAARSFAQKSTEERHMTVLEGEEERMYWDKMAQDREEKVGKKVRVKQRGRNKLLKKAEKELGKHIKFDEV